MHHSAAHERNAVENRVFGIGKQQRQRDAIALVSSLLEPVYEMYYQRAPPPNLARVIVEQSFRMATLEGPGRGLLPIEAIVHACEALQAAYSFLDVGEEAQSACAIALSRVMRIGLEPEYGLPPLARDYLEIKAFMLQSDRQWVQAFERRPGAEVAHRA